MIRPPQTFLRTVLRLAGDVVSLVSLPIRSRAQLVAENLFLRKQLALYLERQVKPRRADDATRIALVALSRLIELASKGIPAVLALEIEDTGSSADSD
jgi:hypothetical protein